MPDRNEQILRKVCQVLAAVLVLRVLWIVIRPNPLSNLVIPDLPQLADATATAAASANNKPASAPASGSPTSTNSGTTATSTNKSKAGSPTNSNAMGVAGSTNRSGTNAPIASAKGTNPPPAGGPPGPPPGMPMMPGMGGPMPMMMMGGMPGMPGMPGGRGGPSVSLDPLTTARIDKIIQSELLGPVPHPLPIALMGIAGQDAFIRTSSGMSGMIHEGAEFGGVKLLRIGTNRVLVEEGGVKKELKIFEGAGGESLLTP